MVFALIIALAETGKAQGAQNFPNPSPEMWIAISGALITLGGNLAVIRRLFSDVKELRDGHKTMSTDLTSIKADMKYLVKRRRNDRVDRSGEGYEEGA